MAKGFVIFVLVSAASWLLGTDTIPKAAHSADIGPAANSNATGGSGTLDTGRAPVPIVRKVSAPPQISVPAAEPSLPPPNATVEPTAVAGSSELPARAELGGTAAKAAVEADGYKRVTLLGRGPKGTWRVKAYRGDTEVVVTVDSAGTVTTE
jgi:hypothetical protein